LPGPPSLSCGLRSGTMPSALAAVLALATSWSSSAQAQCTSGSCTSSSDEDSLLSVRPVSRPVPDLGPALLPGYTEAGIVPAQDTVGTNLENNYTYRYQTDCYGNTSGAGFQCPLGTWCQVEARPNWYPWDVSYMNRGRCLNYTPIDGACEAAFAGDTAFPRKADGTFFTRPVHCGPPGEAICTGEAFSKTLPPTCVRA